MKRLHRLHLTAAAVLVAAVAAGCGANDSATDSANQTQLEPVLTTMDDNRIEATVRSAYFSSDQVKAENIDVSSDRGVVTLRGRVASAETRRHAVSIAEDVDGVTRVDDQLQVGSAGDMAQNAPSADGGTRADRGDRTAGMVTTKILAQYYVNPQLKPWNIDVTTSQDGVVTLAGRIDNDKDRAEAVRIAKSTEGVTEVRDQHHADDVTATAGTTGETSESAGNTLSDAWITTKVQSRFFIDPDIKGRDIDVDTNEGVVVLRGTVGSYSARRQAVGLARSTDGVREVRDELRIDAARAAGDGANSSTANARNAFDDGWITTKIQAKLFVDGDLRSSGIDVTTRNGVVTLTGTASSQEAKESAVQLARDTEGVRSVRDQLKIEAQPAAQSR